MTTELMRYICEVRMLVGFLGEKHQESWWQCLFLSSSSTSFLAPVYPNSIMMAQYSGVCLAAARIHDESIGIGKHYHLYRLPDSTERALQKCFQNQELIELIRQSILTRETALDRLKELGAQNIESSEGPVVIGDYSDADLENLVKIMTSHYTTAFEAGHRTFPYMKCL